MIKIVIKGSLTDLNSYIEAERKNRFFASRIKKENTEDIMWQTEGIPPITEYPVNIEFTWFVKNAKKDPDNISFAKKFILDGLVKNGILKNDGYKQINSFRDFFVIDEDEKVVLEITPI
jgi:Holliday junction resolvase RusA-like endonuclease